jgi:hypothetical protein
MMLAPLVFVFVVIVVIALAVGVYLGAEGNETPTLEQMRQREHEKKGGGR